MASTTFILLLLVAVVGCIFAEEFAPDTYGPNTYGSYNQPRPFGYVFLSQPMEYNIPYGHGKPDFVQLN
ncbi:hypothetical protein QR680_007416 [Steinernema hermaphroditum]|uniref:Uncharacterized protein n=1 Tax=Steinernema hermaphroditum TaxID=289476 RepID=A0AA39ID40_9BILA|nr:hypothetical protein QR680_007416 [Steinernema hermaphroditum]